MTEKEAEWASRVAAWRASGETADTFSAPRGFAASTLRWWASHLGRRTAKAVSMARVEVRPSKTMSSGIRLEVGDARINVDAGFDAEVLRAVVFALRATEAR